jgi:hypothetical protein
LPDNIKKKALMNTIQNMTNSTNTNPYMNGDSLYLSDYPENTMENPFEKGKDVFMKFAKWLAERKILQAQEYHPKPQGKHKIGFLWPVDEKGNMARK